MRSIALLGSTGSIGRQALDVIARHPDLLQASVLTAGHNVELLAEQARRFLPDSVVIASPDGYEPLCQALADLPVKVYAGAEALEQVVQGAEVDMVLTALVGFAGLRPTLAALRAGKPIALANKETLVAAGSIVTAEALRQRVPLLPVDSEHSAIFQCLQGETANPVRRLLLTASGGPFLRYTKEQLAQATAREALQHPTWQMGAKITIDSATMMNKGFELIEACWLFGVKSEQVEVVVHPESVVHSAVEFCDGAVKAQLGLPDMRLPIQYALCYGLPPQQGAAQTCRPSLGTERLDLCSLGALHFERPDEERFPCLRLCREAFSAGGNAPCALNAAGEVCNLAFRRGRIGFLQIPDVVEQVLSRVSRVTDLTLEDVFQTDLQARRMAEEIIGA